MKEEYKGGTFKITDYLSPSYVNLNNPKYIEIDGVYYTCLIVVDYLREQNDLILKNIIETNENIYVSIYYEKQDTYKVIRDLTYNIGNVGVDLEKIGESRQDAEIAAFTYNDAKYIRREMQINNEEMYFIYTYITVFSKMKKELEEKTNKIEGILRSQGLITKKAYFRQEQTFMSCMPFMDNKQDISNVSRRNILTSSLPATYPFISSTIFDETGIFLGTNIYNDSLVFIDRYNREKYKNSNMCIFGTSGSGKSFFTKLMILRSILLDLDQYVIDPDREYTKIGNYLKGSVIKIGPSSDTYVNVLDIREESLEENQKGYLSTKISKVLGFFNLLLGKIDENEKAILEQKLIKTYNQKGINFNDKSLYKNKKFKTTMDMPILEDLYNNLEGKMKTKLLPFIKGSMKYLNKHTNVKLNNKLIIADIYELGEENIKYGMYIFTELFWDKIKQNRKNKKSIYLDEIWQLIGVTSNKEVASFIYKIFKTIRKYGGSAVAITQDVSDLFSLDNGIYGKSILNNSELKAFFNLEEENLKVLEQYSNLSSKEKIEIKSLKRGECVMFVGKEHILTKVESSNFEKNIVGGEEN
ncbi:MAG: DUF87 domain-containing protein [Clostridia bacterium]|nr:DUF87 domain-containing protein [Clostridia bacterium]